MSEQREVVRCVDCEVELGDMTEATCCLCHRPLCAACIGEMGDQVCEGCDEMYDDDEGE